MEEHSRSTGILQSLWERYPQDHHEPAATATLMEIAEYANMLAGTRTWSFLNVMGDRWKRVLSQTENLHWIRYWRSGKKPVPDLRLLPLFFSQKKKPRYAASYLKEKINADSATENTDKEAVSVSYLDRNSQTFHKGLTVTTFYLAKGLEFDQVFGLFRKEVEDCADSIQKQARYITATRALHELFMYSFQS